MWRKYFWEMKKKTHRLYLRDIEWTKEKHFLSTICPIKEEEGWGRGQDRKLGFCLQSANSMGKQWIFGIHLSGALKGVQSSVLSVCLRQHALNQSWNSQAKIQYMLKLKTKNYITVEYNMIIHVWCHCITSQRNFVYTMEANVVQNNTGLNGLSLY